MHPSVFLVAIAQFFFFFLWLGVNAALPTWAISLNATPLQLELVVGAVYIGMFCGAGALAASKQIKLLSDSAMIYGCAIFDFYWGEGVV